MTEIYLHFTMRVFTYPCACALTCAIRTSKGSAHCAALALPLIRSMNRAPQVTPRMSVLEESREARVSANHA